MTIKSLAALSIGAAIGGGMAYPNYDGTKFDWYNRVRGAAPEHVLERRRKRKAQKKARKITRRHK